MKRSIDENSGYYYAQVSLRLNQMLDRNKVPERGRAALLSEITGQSRQWGSAVLKSGTDKVVDISAPTLAKIASYFDCSTDELVGLGQGDLTRLGLGVGSTTLCTQIMINDEAEPYCPKGGAIIYDVNSINLLEGGMFVFGERHIVRRVDIRVDGEVWLHPMNSGYSISKFKSLDELAEHINVVGKIVARVLRT
ncbi:MAG TPA: helix-turn-helix domain-containing protein [Rhodocyclaceae bacterium]|nr:helix-turn-helix domain-containing protein [Rhodocyclaceae bacterium]